MSLDDKYVVHERLPGADHINVVNGVGDVIPDPEAGIYPRESQIEPTPDDILTLDTDNPETSIEILSPQDENLLRVLGLLTLEGFVTFDQQNSALRRPEFSKLTPDASNGKVTAAAQLVFLNMKEEDRAAKDPRTGS